MSEFNQAEINGDMSGPFTWGPKELRGLIDARLAVICGTTRTDGITPARIEAAAAFEFIHVASLIIDDFRDVAAVEDAPSKEKGLDCKGAGKGLLSVMPFFEALYHYRRLSLSLDGALAGLWFDTSELATYFRAVLPDDPVIGPEVIVRPVAVAVPPGIEDPSS